MRKLKLQIQMSLDGFIAGPKGELDWLVQDWDDALNNYVKAITASIDLIVLGRKLAQSFIPFWAAAAAEKADAGSKKMSDTPKIVFSKTLKRCPWEGTTLANGDLAGEINNLKHQAGKDMIVYGGGNFVSNLMQQNLIDEYHLLIDPTVIGEGIAIFKGLQRRLNLKLVKAIPFECGIVVLFYKPAKLQ